MIPPLLLYLKLPFPMNKQFSIDSFLDLEGLHWDFSSPITSPPISVLPPFRRRSIERANFNPTSKSRIKPTKLTSASLN